MREEVEDEDFDVDEVMKQMESEDWEDVIKG